MALKNGRTTAALQTILIGSVIPPGVIQAFGGGTVPSGWLLCDGSTASRSTYAGLFAAVGIVHGQGNGSTTFHLPDLRGRFLRGADNMGTGAAGRDPDAAGRTAANTGGNTGNAIGSVQSDAHQNIIGQLPGTWRSGDTGTGTGAFYKYSTGASTAAAGVNANSGIGIDTSLSPGQRTSTETRPSNANSSYIIKV
jgi:microcystin-dependent protein